MKKRLSDFKLISIALLAVLIFFTISYFRNLPLAIFNIDIKTLSKGFNIFYVILTELMALAITIIFVLTYFKKTDNELKKRYKSIGIGLGAIAVYYILPYFQIIPFMIFKVSPEYIPIELEIMYLMAFSSLTAAIIIFIHRKKLTKDFKNFKKNSNKYFFTAVAFAFWDKG